MHRYIRLQIVQKPYNKQGIPNKKKKAVESGWGNVISIFLNPERILANGCNSLGYLGHLVYFDLFINGLEIQILQVRP